MFNGEDPAPVTAPNCVVKKNDPENIILGFVLAGSEAELKAQCTEYGQILLQPSIL